jgi:hypothetical protein
MQKFSSPFPDEDSRGKMGVDPGNGVRTSVELNRNETLRYGVWALIDEYSSWNRKSYGMRAANRAKESGSCETMPR